MAANELLCLCHAVATHEQDKERTTVTRFLGSSGHAWRQQFQSWGSALTATVSKHTPVFSGNYIAKWIDTIWNAKVLSVYRNVSPRQQRYFFHRSIKWICFCATLLIICVRQEDYHANVDKCAGVAVSRVIKVKGKGTKIETILETTGINNEGCKETGSVSIASVTPSLLSVRHTGESVEWWIGLLIMHN